VCPILGLFDSWPGAVLSYTLTILTSYPSSLILDWPRSIILELRAFWVMDDQMDDFPQVFWAMDDQFVVLPYPSVDCKGKSLLSSCMHALPTLIFSDLEVLLQTCAVCRKLQAQP
jgi:hypothetical protein